MLIDGPSLVYRGYFALPPLTMSDGTLVNAVFGFLQIVLRGMQDLKPDYAIVSFDLGRPQFRFDAYPEYKAGRPSMPDDLRAQFPIVREIAQMMGMPIRELEGYEADDVIGSLVQGTPRGGRGHLHRLRRPGRAAAGRTTTSGCSRPGWASPSTVIYDEARVDGALRPAPGPDARLQGAQGRHLATTSPACRGWGRRRPSSCSRSSGRSTRIYERLDEVKGKLRERLAEHRESAFLSREVGADRHRPARSS